MLKKKNVIAGLGEIGLPIIKLISSKNIAVGHDINSNLEKAYQKKKFSNFQTSFLHICIPFNPKFTSNVIQLYKKFNPELIVIHSTVKPYTTQIIQKKLDIPIIFSPTRGIHKHMLDDIKHYTKFFAIEKHTPRSKWASLAYSKLMKTCGVKTKKMSNPITLELAKIICDTSYYGWLINYAQLSNVIAIQHKIDYDEMWSFADEIHKFLGNRPKMFPGFIGGHCVIPNLDLIHNQSLNLIKKMNNDYVKKVPKARKISRKYEKSKRLK